MHSPLATQKLSRPSPACIQIWSFGPPTNSPEEERVQRSPDGREGVVQCEMILCLEDGPAQEIKWCPLPAHDAARNLGGNGVLGPSKLGILAGAFGDGSVTIFTVPDPSYVRNAQANGEHDTSPTFGTTRPLLSGSKLLNDVSSSAH